MKKKQKTFVVHEDDYMGSGTDMCIQKATSLKEILREKFDWHLEGDAVTIKGCNEINGDGMQYVTILDLKTGKKVFG